VKCSRHVFVRDHFSATSAGWSLFKPRIHAYALFGKLSDAPSLSYAKSERQLHVVGALASTKVAIVSRLRPLHCVWIHALTPGSCEARMHFVVAADT